MFLGLHLIDWILILAIIAQLWTGWRKAFMVSLGATAGFLAGAAAAFFCIPLMARTIQDPAWRAAGLFITFAVLLALGQGLGEAAAAQIRRWMDRPRPRWWDRLGGSVVYFAATWVTISALAFTWSALGMPWLSPQLANSRVVQAVRDTTPEVMERSLGEARQAVAALELPEISLPRLPSPRPVPGDPSPSVSPDAGIPADSDLTDAQNAVKGSVARVTGIATECGVNQTGTSFAIAPDRLLTNAHVVRGIEQPVVETPDGRALTGRTVTFDSRRDIAVIAVDGLDMRPLEMGRTLRAGDEAAFMGFPAGGPYTVSHAAVKQRAMAQLPNIYGSGSSQVDVYQLAADVKRGNSGGPLVASDGTFRGMIFAKSKDEDNVGYAITNDELKAIVDEAPSRSTAVSTGSCK
ncbi:MarP family serine protease [Pseudoglutamicibacter cumminsii]|uniref:MarP family serine protease n=1 Tax=Pseudoglutamicibacter cumminsii TaxID=156979 RepID=A0AAP4FDV2_9MICC|nr:MarP family serine protease [Pseudoglutamicibacter cumminsii]MDK6275699.1 MarP family serine protease [Pseudoglutamicibacter cumminsii]MDK7083382.1 MarP family serine protease [Pseudoglutamicibacter cumminsii]MDZ3745028.1 MarP family serine protease [Pseudoglutamicibacter cumminsii]